MKMEKVKQAGSDCHCINLRRAANAVTAYYDTMLSETGITLNQYSILSNLHKIEPCSVAELSRRVRLDRTTLVRNLKGMHASGWVRDDANPGNRRSRLRLTDAGLEKIRLANPFWKQAQDHIGSYLGEDALQTLTKTLLLLENLSDMA